MRCQRRREAPGASATAPPTLAAACQQRWRRAPRAIQNRWPPSATVAVKRHRPALTSGRLLSPAMPSVPLQPVLRPPAAKAGGERHLPTQQRATAGKASSYLPSTQTAGATSMQTPTAARRQRPPQAQPRQSSPAAARRERRRQASPPRRRQQPCADTSDDSRPDGKAGSNGHRCANASSRPTQKPPVSATPRPPSSSRPLPTQATVGRQRRRRTLHPDEQPPAVDNDAMRHLPTSAGSPPPGKGDGERQPPPRRPHPPVVNADSERHAHAKQQPPSDAASCRPPTPETPLSAPPPTPVAAARRQRPRRPPPLGHCQQSPTTNARGKHHEQSADRKRQDDADNRANKSTQRSHTHREYPSEPQQKRNSKSVTMNTAEAARKQT